MTKGLPSSSLHGLQAFLLGMRNGMGLHISLVCMDSKHFFLGLHGTKGLPSSSLHGFQAFLLGMRNGMGLHLSSWDEEWTGLHGGRVPVGSIPFLLGMRNGLGSFPFLLRMRNGLGSIPFLLGMRNLGMRNTMGLHISSWNEE
ncbi:hypothetical protein AMTR_s00029p00159920 [Amborella trichopoda]|uniref:Uncharacterized protein n=1 Tax=Amborella trichopoda TaxID=13333 RepID=W1PNB7_AMBTC|nr:hypothetical protein AMTR_s00029p00159920 [Amborella trichopoda]